MIGQFTLRPRRGTFDLRDVHAFFDLHPYTARDPIEPDVYHVCGDNATLRRVVEHRRRDTHNLSMPFSGCLVVMEPKAVTVNQYCKPSHRENCRPFVEWFLKKFRCRVEDPQGSEVAGDPGEILDKLYG